MDDLLGEFVAETREMLEAIESEIVAWENDPGDRARLDAIFRFVHTVKGNCGFFDFPRLEKLSHAAESALAEVRAGRRSADVRLVNAVLAIIDRIAQMADAIEAGVDLPGGGDEFLIAALEPDQNDVGECVAMFDADSEAQRAHGPSATPRSIRLPVELLDRVMSGVSDMVLARNDLARRLRSSGAEPTIDGPFERLSGILTDVRDAITRMRMQRIEYLYNALPRLVRDLSAELGKQVMVDMEGGDVELDREMIEMIRDPITHIIRNAIDHGVESPSQRLAAGKREIALLGFAARQSGNKITLTISDDGAGINVEKLAAKAAALGLLSEREIDQMSRDDLHQLIFEPGLSTADEVSAVSGRGVGMDVVRANLEKIGGRVKVSSKRGEGTLFQLEIPLTISIVAGLTVGVASQRFAIPQSYVEEIAHSASAAIEYSQLGDADLVTFRGHRIPCLSLARILGIDPEADVHGKTLVLVRLGSGNVFAIAVDRIFDHEDLVVKPLAPAVMATGIYAGTTLLDDGNPILMLDIPTIALQNGLTSEIRVRPAPIARQNETAARPDRQIMLFDGIDGRRRAIGMELVRRIHIVAAEAIDIEGRRSQVVIDGAILPLVGLVEGTIVPGPLKLLRLSDGQAEIAYAVGNVTDSALIEGEIVACQDDPAIEGVTLIDGMTVPVISGMNLFARHERAAVGEPPLTCCLPDGDEWSRTMLAPLVTAAGYRIVSDSAAQADITFTLDAHEPPKSSGGTVIRLHGDADSPDAGTGSIYRYDRDALLGALKSARAGRM